MKTLILAFLVVMFLAVSVGTAHAQETFDVKFEWDANIEPDLAGYRMYYGTAPRTYNQSKGQGVEVGLITTYEVMGLTLGTMYYFAVTAYDNEIPSLESNYSNEIATNGIINLPPVPPGMFKAITITIHKSDGTTVIIAVP